MTIEEFRCVFGIKQENKKLSKNDIIRKDKALRKKERKTLKQNC